MELIGLKVNHAVFGVGTITEKDGNYITVEFSTKTTKFADGDYLYSGEGKTGDQTMTKGNLAIRDAARNGKEIQPVRKVFSPRVLLSGHL